MSASRRTTRWARSPPRNNVHFCAAQVNFRFLEYKLAKDAPWAKDPYLPRDGHLDLRPDRPGWGYRDR